MTPPPEYRSGAVARMLGMPVATLRVWERRYAVCQPRLSEGGHRLYSTADVQRLALIQQLVAQGHAIGRLATLDLAALQAVAATHAGAHAASRAGTQLGLPARHWPPEPPVAPTRPLKVCVTDPVLRTRWQQARWRRIWPARVQWVRDPAQAQVRIDHAARLLPDERLPAPAPGVRWGVVVRYASAPALAALEAAGACLLREPADAPALADWLARLLPPDPAPDAAPDAAADTAGQQPGGLAEADPPPPRWDDATLEVLASLSTTVACECPRHLAELLIQLGQFEAYSAQCASRDAEDAALHRDLQRVSGQARLLLEEALARVAQAEGLLPGAVAPGRHAA